MMKTKRFGGFGKKALPVLLAAVLAMFAFSIPAYAADETPGENGTSTEASVTFNPGELKLEKAPALDFGSHPVSDAAQEYAVETIGDPLRVSDLRGSGDGWKLMASLSNFKLADETVTLQAAEIKTTGPSVITVGGNIGAPPAAFSEITLPSDNTQTPVWAAEKDEGMGVWELEWQKANTKLLVKPGTARTGKSVATITWSLQSTP